MKEVGIKADKDQLKILMESIKGKKLHEIIAAGMSKIQSVGSAPAPAPAAAADEKAGKGKKGDKKGKKEEKVEEKKEEPEDALEGGINLFGDDEGY